MSNGQGVMNSKTGYFCPQLDSDIDSRVEDLATSLQEDKDYLLNRIDELESAVKEIYAMRGEDKLIKSICDRVLKV